MAGYSEYNPSLSRVCPEYIPSLYSTQVKLGLDLGRTGVIVGVVQDDEGLCRFWSI